MKVLHVLNHFLPETIAGTEIYVMSLINESVKKGITCSVVIPNLGSVHDTRYEIDSVPVFKYAEPSIAERQLIMGKKKPKGLSAFLNVVKQENPDIVHFHELAGSNGITMHHVTFAKAAGFKVIMTFHLAGYSCKTGNLMYKDDVLCDGIIRNRRCTACYFHVKKTGSFISRLLAPLSMLLFHAGINTTGLNNKPGTALGFPFVIEKLRKDLHTLADSCDKLIVLTQWYRKILVKNNISPEKIVIIKQALPGGDDNAIKKQERNTGILRIIFVGRITRVKGIHLIIEALRDIKGKVTLDIYGQVGEEDYAQECRSMTDQMTSISWKGIIPSAEVINTISAYDILCLPSAFSEMSPLVIQEAYAAGVPVLASEVYGNAEQIKDGVTGWLFKFKDYYDLRIKIQALIDQPDLIEVARKNIPAVRKFDAVANEYVQIYNKVLTS